MKNTHEKFSTQVSIAIAGGSVLLTLFEDYTSLNFAEVIVDFMDSLHIPKAILMATDIALLPVETECHPSLPAWRHGSDTPDQLVAQVVTKFLVEEA